MTQREEALELGFTFDWFPDPEPDLECFDDRLDPGAEITDVRCCAVALNGTVYASVCNIIEPDQDDVLAVEEELAGEALRRLHDRSFTGAMTGYNLEQRVSRLSEALRRCVAVLDGLGGRRRGATTGDLTDGQLNDALVVFAVIEQAKAALEENDTEGGKT